MNNIHFTFNLSVSTTYYQGKCNEWGRLRYQTKEMNIDTLEEYIKQGYCFTHTFKQVDADGSFGCKQKNIKNFKSTNTVFLDVDDSSTTASDFYWSVTPQPTILYTTPSNITGEKNRFRLIYVFNDLITDNDFYRELVGKISCRIRQYFSDFVFDATSVNVSQQMGGNGTDDCLLLKSYNIYDFDTFKEYDRCTSNAYIKKKRNDISNRNAESCENKTSIIDKEFIVEFWEIDNEVSVHNLLNKYRDKYPLYDCTQVDEDTPYISLDDGYVEISRRYYVKKDAEGKNYSVPVRIKQGNRERILFNNALLRLKINPEMTFENLLYALVYERQYWVDNSDGEFTNRKLYKIAEGAFVNRALYDISTSTIGQKRKRRRTNKNGYKVNKSFCDKYSVSAHTMANYMRTDITNEVLLENYDFNLTVKENSKKLKENGIKPNSERRLYQFKKWCIENNIIKTDKNEEI